VVTHAHARRASRSPAAPARPARSAHAGAPLPPLAANCPDIRLALQDERLQSLLLKIDSAPNRETALQQALQQPAFREFADAVIDIVKPPQPGL
jgi:hypothetical protein